MRRCCACGREGERESFLRFVELEGKPVFDPYRKLPGRGFNVCPTRECLKKFLKKHFKGKVEPERLYSEVLEALKKQFLNTLSLCHRTGITVIGQDNVKGFRKRKGVLILCKDLSPKTKERLKNCGELVVEDVFTMEEVGSSLKKNSLAGVVFVEMVGLGRKLYEVGRKLNFLRFQKVQVSD